MRSIRRLPAVRGVLHLAALAVAAAVAAAGCASAAGRSASAGRAESEASGSEGGAPAVAAESRVQPYAVRPALEYAAAVMRGTRTADGRPGPGYWQQWAEYDLDARLLVEEKRLEGTAGIRYTNNSPDSLAELHVELALNLHAPGALRNQPAETTGGVEVRRVAVGGRALERAGEEEEPGEPGRPGPTAGPRYEIDDTQLVIHPPAPLAPGATAELEVDWGFLIPQAGASGRMGWDDDNLFYLAYWYPQMAVYDDVIGWMTDPFLGSGEFYADFARYDVTLDVPAGWVVMGTGELVNREDALAPSVLRRLEQAEGSDEIVHVLTEADFGRATSGGRGGRLTWHFQADSVRDVAYGITRESLWDATRTSVGDRDGDGDEDHARVDAFYRETAPRWTQSARYGQHAIAFLSRYTGIPYPWPHMTAVEAGGIIGGGMEYPMMTLIGDYNVQGDTALYAVTAHEFAHMWVPMIVSNNERRYGWMDEGTTTFNENNAKSDFYPGVAWQVPDQANYLAIVLNALEGEVLRWSDYHYNPAAFTIASYQKPASALHALRAILGEETFDRAYREYLARWAYKHPYPWDMFNTFEDVSGRDLDWFWRSWYYETWVLEQGIESVTPGEDGTRIVIRDRGMVPMPAIVEVTLSDGSTVRREVPVETWLEGAREATVTLDAADVQKVEIDPDLAFPDLDRSNNVWEAGGGTPAREPAPGD
jgi:hypothetical protein